MRVLVTLTPLLLLITLLFSGCSWIHFAPPKRSVVSPTAPSGSIAGQPLEKNRSKIERAVADTLADNDLEQAHKLLLDSRQKRINEELLAHHYTTVGNRLLDEAKRAEKAGQPERAGTLFRMTMQIYPADPQLQTTLNLTPQEIDRHIEQCAATMMKEGLMIYRSGELLKAISIWQAIGRFHPEHRASRIAIETAEQQLKNLELLAAKDTL